MTCSTICTSDLHIIHGAVPRATPDTVLGHEFVGVVERVGEGVRNLRPGDRVAVSCETFCGECFYCERGWVNNCVEGGWELGCCADGCQAALVRVPYADRTCVVIPADVTDEAALFLGDIVATGHWGADIAQIEPGSAVAVIGAGPVGLATMMCARPHGVVVLSAMYEGGQTLPLHQMYGKNLVFKTGGVDACNLSETMRLVQEGRIDTSCLISARYPLNDIVEAYRAFEAHEGGGLKFVITPWE